MLGITTPDAIAFGSLCAALLAAYAGLVNGDRARQAAACDPSMSAVGLGPAERMTLRDLVLAMQDLAAVLRDGVAAVRIAALQDRQDLGDAIRDLAVRLDERERRGR